MLIVPCLLKHLKSLDNMDKDGVKRIAVGPKSVANSPIRFMCLIAMKITLGSCYDGAKDDGKNCPRGVSV